MNRFGFIVILNSYLIPFMENYQCGECKLIQDNDSKHRSKVRQNI